MPITNCLTNRYPAITNFLVAICFHNLINCHYCKKWHLWTHPKTSSFIVFFSKRIFLHFLLTYSSQKTPNPFLLLLRQTYGFLPKKIETKGIWTQHNFLRHLECLTSMGWIEYWWRWDGAQVKCKVCSKIEGMDKLLAPKLDSPRKHNGRRKALVVIPRIYKARKFYMKKI